MVGAEGFEPPISGCNWFPEWHDRLVTLVPLPVVLSKWPPSAQETVALILSFFTSVLGEDEANIQLGFQFVATNVQLISLSLG